MGMIQGAVNQALGIVGVAAKLGKDISKNKSETLPASEPTNDLPKAENINNQTQEPIQQQIVNDVIEKANLETRKKILIEQKQLTALKAKYNAISKNYRSKKWEGVLSDK